MSPLSWPYYAVSKLRNYCYDQNIFKSYSSSLKVICVGNVVCGGSGKTPVVQDVVRQLGEGKCAILLRGYKGSLKGPQLVNQKHTVKEVGDEAVLHFQKFKGKVPVVICADRVLGAEFIENNTNAEYIVMDDGFQHRRLRRDLDIVLVPEGVRREKERELLPLGPCRESYSDGLSRASLVLCYSEEDQKFLKDFYGVDAQILQRRPVGLRDLFSGTAESGNIDFTLVSATARPERLRETVSDLGLKVTSEKFFPDHYYFSQEDYSALKKPIVCTGKDAVKLREFVREQGLAFEIEEEVSTPQVCRFEQVR